MGYSMTAHRETRLKVAASSVQRLKKRLKVAFRQGRGRNRQRFIEELQPLLRGWVQYFKLAEVKGTFEELDGWIRRHLRCLIWRQWKRTWTRAKNLRARGLTEKRAWKSATNGRGPWWNARASHMHAAFPKAYFDRLGLVSLLTEQRRFQRFREPPWYGTVCPVVWEDGRGDPASYPIPSNHRIGPQGREETVLARAQRLFPARGFCITFGRRKLTW